VVKGLDGLNSDFFKKKIIVGEINGELKDGGV
jgi:hypothetical protein